MHQSRVNRRARVATVAAFATNGALPASMLARYAEVKETLNVDAGLFGLMVAGFMLGAAGAFNTPGVFLRRWGSPWVTSLGTVWVAAAFVLAALGVALINPWLFAAGLVLAGYADAVVDVAQNSQGLRVQEAYRRNLLSSMHAGWSIGAATGGLVGVLAASLAVPLIFHLGAWGLLCALSMIWASRSFLPDRSAPSQEDEATGTIGRRAIWLLVPLALVALAGVSVEDIGNNWSAVLLTTERGVSLSAAGIGLAVLLGAQFIGRMLGDRFIDRVGTKAAVVTSLSFVVIGLNLAAWAPWPALTLVGLAAAGLGCAITVPLAFAGADSLPGLKAHAGVTWVNWIMRAATIVLTPAIGGITTIVSLPVAITVMSLIAFVALAMQMRRQSSGGRMR